MSGMAIVILGAALPAMASTADLPPNQHVRAELLGAFHDHMAGEHEDTGRGTCLTGLVQQLKANWDVFSAVERAELTSALAPWKDDLLDPESRPPVPPAPMAGSCWGYQYGDNYIDTEHFSVQWEEDSVSINQAQNFADALEYSWGVEIDELGWREPSGSSQYKMLVRIERMGGGGGAYTTVDHCGGGWRPYIVASHRSFDQGNWYKTMACHELHHAIQYAYGFAHEFWWWEATSTWIEDLVYPALNDWRDALYVYSLKPYMGMNAFAGNSNDQYLFYHTYAMGIWGMFLDQHVGGNDLVKDTWEESRRYNCQYCVWMPDTIGDTGNDFDAVYAEFLGTNAVMDYNDRMFLESPTLTDQVSSLPAEGGSRSIDAPQSLGANYIRFDEDMGEPGMVLRVDFSGNEDADYWIATLVSGETTVDEQIVFDLEDGFSGVAEIPFEGDAAVHLVVSPVYETAQGYSYQWSHADEFDYSWSADVVDPDAVVGGTEDADGDDTPRKGAGCSTTPRLPGGLALIGLVALGCVGYRRR